MTKRKLSLNELFENSRIFQQKKEEKRKLEKEKEKNRIKEQKKKQLKKEEQKKRDKQEKKIHKQTLVFKTYSTQYIERHTSDDDLFQTREELQQWEKDNHPCINWDKWEEIMTSTKRQLKQT